MSNLSEEKIIKKFKECEVVDYLEDDYTTTLTWVKDGILDIIEKQQKQIKSLEQENSFLKQLYSSTTEFKAISKLAESEI